MSSNFFSLPRELRDRIYELVLLHQELIDPWAGRYGGEKPTPELLHVNKDIHREASSLFYAENRFDFTNGTSEDVASFLRQIGRNNAGYIRHICVDFPKFLNLEPDNVTLDDDSVGILANIRNGCANLSTLTTSLSSTNAMELNLDALDSPKVISEALNLVNTHFRAISFLQKIVVEVYEDGPSDYIRRQMESHRWTISVVEYVEEEDFDRSFSDFGCDDHSYDSDSDGHDDDYDIDNDSDFWRRAAD